MTPAHLARWARRFPRGRLRGPPGELAWDAEPPPEPAFVPWVAPGGPVTAELAFDELVVTLLPGVTLAVERAARLRIEVPLSTENTLGGPGTAAVHDATWRLRCGPWSVPAFDTLALLPDGRLELSARGAGRGRGAALRAGSRLLTAALRRSPRWSAVTRFLPGRGPGTVRPEVR
jgi:hypothetical protein